jgi:hypothetical protein
MTAGRQRLHIFILSDMVQIKRGRKSIELIPFDEADALGRDLCLAVAAARATQPIRHPRPAASPVKRPEKTVEWQAEGGEVRRPAS